MPYIPLRRGAGRLFDENLNRMLQDLFGGAAILETATAAQIADVSNAVNTTGKVVGRQLWDTTNNRIMVSSGTAAASAWFVADGSASVTPA